MVAKKDKKVSAATNKKIEMMKKLTDGINKKYKQTMVNFASNDEVKAIPRIPSSSLKLDYALGGGWPEGRIIEIYGPESSGKSTLCLHALAEAQRKFPNVPPAIIDTEYSLDPIYATSLGVNMQELLISQPDSGNNGFGVLQDLIEGGIKFIVVDSIAAMIPKQQLESEDIDSAMGSHARMMSAGLRKIQGVIGKYGATVIFTNQIRMKIGVMFGNPETTCVTPDTRVEIESQEHDMAMETLFKIAGLNWKLMEKNVPYDIRDKNIKIKSFNHESKTNELKQILSLVHKDDVDGYQLVTKMGDILLKCSGDHRIFDAKVNDYVKVKDVKEGFALSNTNEKIEFFTKKTGKIYPIVDMEVEGNSNYFSNGLLSHNTGGNAMKFYASIRLDVRKIGKAESDPGGEELVRQKMKVVARKNKTAPPFRQCELVVEFGKGVDPYAEVFEIAVENGFIKKKGAWFEYDGANIAQGGAKALQWLIENKDVYTILRAKAQEFYDNKSKGIVIEAEEITEEDRKTQDETSDIVEAGEV